MKIQLTIIVLAFSLVTAKASSTDEPSLYKEKASAYVMTDEHGDIAMASSDGNEATPGAFTITSQNLPTDQLSQAALKAANNLQSGLIKARSLATRFIDTINIIDNGAKCDGISDDTVIIQNVLNKASGKSRVYVPDGRRNCVVTGLSIPSDTNLIIDGTLYLKSQSNTSVIKLPKPKNVSITGVGTIDANGLAQAERTGGGINGTGINIYIAGITITNARNWPVNLAGFGGEYLYMEKLTLTNSGNSVEFNHAKNCWAQELNISGIRDIGFAFYGDVHQCGISKSTITNNIASGINILADISQPDPSSQIFIIDNNIFGNGLGGFSVVNGKGAEGTHSNIALIHNNFYRNDTRDIPGVADVAINNVAGFLAFNNVIHDGGNGTKSMSGLLIENADTVTISKNTIYDMGIGGTNGVGIQVQPSGKSVLITNNNIYDDQKIKTMAFGINGTAGPSTKIIGNNIGKLIGPGVNLKRAADTVFNNAETK